MKTIVIFLLLFFFTSSYSQNLSGGEWTTSAEEISDEMKVQQTGICRFSSDSTLFCEGRAHIVITFDRDTSYECNLTYSASGTYSLSQDSVITFRYDPESFQMTEGKITLPGIVKGLLLKPLKSEMKKQFKKPSREKLIFFSEKEMHLLPDEKNAPAEVFYRK